MPSLRERGRRKGGRRGKRGREAGTGLYTNNDDNNNNNNNNNSNSSKNNDNNTPSLLLQGGAGQPCRRPARLRPPLDNLHDGAAASAPVFMQPAGNRASLASSHLWFASPLGPLPVASFHVFIPPRASRVRGAGFLQPPGVFECSPEMFCCLVSCLLTCVCVCFGNVFSAASGQHPEVTSVTKSCSRIAVRKQSRRPPAVCIKGVSVTHVLFGVAIEWLSSVLIN